ncbi:hypothetical protein M427DRAFT_61336 [Gonapodya prolifera JEL478]|uniref:Uncharacterized protein n=1 Tax=Gonapodya prolifera (strain JEL478) TaxID=1344416 RepID=A0A139A2G4_GONPJ|nr:hypothetical protein M427DRAFT_61336 [Gonapodya prolifera JEL478]|eukprot:KXS10976.1 hypothetical protein M427DRAFT_61336 [Gonapodya prolifera JEL478]
MRGFLTRISAIAPSTQSFHVESGESLPTAHLEKRAPGSWEYVKCPGNPTELTLLGWKTQDGYEVARYDVYVNGRWKWEKAELRGM